MAGISHDYLRGFSLDSIHTLIEMSQETWTLKIRSEGRVGYLYFEKGEIIDAQVQNLNGNPAAIELITWDSPEIQILKYCVKSRRIETSMIHLLLEGKRIKDETRADRVLAQGLYDEAVENIQGLRFKRGQEKLVALLHKDRRHSKGWLWYSRISGTLKAIGGAIDRALYLAPEDPEALAEKERFTKASRFVTDAKVKHCPFCWAPLNVNAMKCTACGLHLLISKASMAAESMAGDPDVIDASVKRFSTVLTQEKNLYVTYYMAICHYNMGDQDRALELLNDTVTLGAGQPFFSSQLKLYLNWMASQQFTEKEALAEVPRTDAAGEGKTILVVEDSSTTRKIISVTLKMKGYRIVEAVDGLEALSRLSEEIPDLVLLDIILPKMNGYEILAIIKNKREFKNLPVIMLTSRDGFMSRMKGKIAGTAAYLTKPFNPDDLLQTIVKHI